MCLKEVLPLAWRLMLEALPVSCQRQVVVREANHHRSLAHR